MSVIFYNYDILVKSFPSLNIPNVDLFKSIKNYYKYEKNTLIILNNRNIFYFIDNNFNKIRDEELKLLCKIKEVIIDTENINNFEECHEIIQKIKQKEISKISLFNKSIF